MRAKSLNRSFIEVGIFFGCNTQINRRSAPEFPLIYEHIRDAGAKAWQIQLTVPMGNAADNADILLQPYELLDVYPMLARVTRRAHREGVDVQPGNNIGYYLMHPGLRMTLCTLRLIAFNGLKVGKMKWKMKQNQWLSIKRHNSGF